jgi:hypothetical protein
LVIVPRGGCCWSSETAFNLPALEEGRPLAFASELAVGTNSREVIEDNLEDDPVEVLEVTEAAPKVFFEPILLTAPVEEVLVDDARVPIEDTLAVWPEFLELEIPVPVSEALELVRLVRVPALLCRLFLEAEVLPKEGSGDLEREPEDEVEVEVPFPIASMLGTASLPSSSTLASGLLLALRTEGILLPLATAVVGWAGAIDDFALGPRGGGPILAFDAAGLVEAFTFVSVGLGILLATAGAGAFPRFHTL